MRYFITFSYNGKDYHGWQRQLNAISVQEIMEDAFQKIAQEKIDITAAGRTDTGVHAKKMVAHADIHQPIKTEELVRKLNAFLPKSIAIQQIVTVNNDAHARFDAISRTYEYWITFEKNPFLTDFAYYIKQPLDINLMNNAAKELLKYDNFQSFSKTNTDVKTFLCNITKAFWEVKNDTLIFTITANRFLRNMVRAIVGTLLKIGKKDISIITFKQIIESKNRSNAGASVPAHALYLTKIKYPTSIVKNEAKK